MAKAKPEDEALPPEQPIEDASLPEEDAIDEGDSLDVIEEAPSDAVETPTLSAAEMEKIRKQAEKQVAEEFKKKLRERAMDAERKKARERLSMAENEHLNGPLSDLVRIRIDIPEFSNVPWIQLNQPHGQCYLHGQVYTVKRHIANTLRESMQAMRRHQAEIDGKKRNRYVSELNGAGYFIDAVTGHRSQGKTTVSADAA